MSPTPGAARPERRRSPCTLRSVPGPRRTARHSRRCPTGESPAGRPVPCRHTRSERHECGHSRRARGRMPEESKAPPRRGLRQPTAGTRDDLEYSFGASCPFCSAGPMAAECQHFNSNWRELASLLPASFAVRGRRALIQRPVPDVSKLHGRRLEPPGVQMSSCSPPHNTHAHRLRLLVSWLRGRGGLFRAGLRLASPLEGPRGWRRLEPPRGAGAPPHHTHMRTRPISEGRKRQKNEAPEWVSSRSLAGSIQHVRR